MLLPQLSMQIRKCAHRPISENLSKPAQALLRACLVREPTMRAGPKQLALIYLKPWAKEVGRAPAG